MCLLVVTVPRDSAVAGQREYGDVDAVDDFSGDFLLQREPSTAMARANP
jgi:hypothetical protein